MITGYDDIAALCAQTPVDPIHLIHEMLEGLESRHRVYRVAYGSGADAGMFIEISDLVTAASPDGEETPRSLLAALELHLRVRADRERDNIPLHMMLVIVQGYLQKGESPTSM